MTSKPATATKAPAPPDAEADDEEGFVSCRVYFKDSFHAGGVSRSSFDPVRDKSRYNPVTGIIRAEIGGSIELSIHGGWGPAIFRV